LTHGRTPPLSSESLGAAIAVQSDDEVETAAARGRSGETPAARARALIESDPSLAERPFGQIVSALARGGELAPALEDGDPGPEAEGGAGESPDLAEGPDLAPPPPEGTVDEALAEVLEEMVGDEEDAGA